MDTKALAIRTRIFASIAVALVAIGFFLPFEPMGKYGVMETYDSFAGQLTTSAIVPWLVIMLIGVPSAVGTFRRAIVGTLAGLTGLIATLLCGFAGLAALVALPQLATGGFLYAAAGVSGVIASTYYFRWLVRGKRSERQTSTPVVARGPALRSA